MFMTDFITENWKFLAIVGGVILSMTLLYFAYVWHCKSKLKKYNRQHANDVDKINIEKQISLQDLIDQEIISTYESKNNKQNGTHNDVVPKGTAPVEPQPVSPENPTGLPLEDSSEDQESVISENQSASAEPLKKATEESVSRPKQVIKEESV
ncbi:MAG: hypothetical protein JXB20_05190, partial [Bacilli bacterium]|nr:hypothetical protein [Bacilli bacterium]